MSDPEAIYPQPKGERAKFISMWTALALASGVVIWRTLPYDFSEQSPMLAKGEIFRSIGEVRSGPNGHWPKDQNDPAFKIGPMATKEVPAPEFHFVRIRKEGSIEYALYRLTFRGSTSESEIAIDPKAKPKKRRF